MNVRSRIFVVVAATWLVASLAVYWSGLGLDRYSDWAVLWSRAVPLHAIVPLYQSSCLEQPAVIGGELYFGCKTDFSALGYAVLALLPVILLAMLVGAVGWVRNGFRSA